MTFFSFDYSFSKIIYQLCDKSKQIILNTHMELNRIFFSRLFQVLIQPKQTDIDVLPHNKPIKTKKNICNDKTKRYSIKYWFAVYTIWVRCVCVHLFVHSIDVVLSSTVQDTKSIEITLFGTICRTRRTSDIVNWSFHLSNEIKEKRKTKLTESRSTTISTKICDWEITLANSSNEIESLGWE